MYSCQSFGCMTAPEGVARDESGDRLEPAESVERQRELAVGRQIHHPRQRRPGCIRFEAEVIRAAAGDEQRGDDADLLSRHRGDEGIIPQRRGGDDCVLTYALDRHRLKSR